MPLFVLSLWFFFPAAMFFFFLRALRICSHKFLNDEFEHIRNSFSKLHYSESFIHHAKSKALNIHKHTSHNMNKNKPSTNTNPNITSKSHYHP